MAASDLTPADRALIAAAETARARAHAPYSNYTVGAALRTADGEIVLGCNVENIVLGETICAEKVALVKAVSDGQHHFEAVAIETGSSPPASPCGSCRQMLLAWGVARVVLHNDQGEAKVYDIRELLPAAFDLKEF